MGGLVTDPINHPAHYTAGMPEGIGVIDIIRAQDANFEHGSAIKYLLRWKYKNGLEDLRKCRRFIDWMIEEEERNGAH